MTRRTFKQLFSILFFAAALFSLNAETILDNDFGFSLDIPEGFKLAENSDDGMSYHLAHPNIPVDLIIKTGTDKTVSSTSEALALNIKKLNGTIQQDDFDWNKTTVSIGTFNMQLDQKYSGWAVCVPTKVQDYFLTLLCYAPEDKEPACEQFIMSTLNSLCINDDDFNRPGIITAYAFPSEGVKEIELTIEGKKIKTQIDKIDEEASQFVVDMEYGVLSLYSKHNLWKEAWQRYYRMIYRDSFGRIENVCSDAFETLYPMAKKSNPQNPSIAYAQYLLSWVQNFEYKRAEEHKDSDFTCLPGVLCGKGNDCDSRSLLICTMLKAVGVECILLVSPTYAHALAAAMIDAPGQQFTLEGTDLNFIMGETTAKVTWGMIAQDQADRTKWFPVILP